MRFIAQCHQCDLQYWSEDNSQKQNFYCQCGERITLNISSAKEARVVRCSSCGAPREKNSPFCVACKSDFTIHEKDLNTLCPQCMTRISDKARYCHFCAVSIRPQIQIGKGSQQECPACAGNKKLSFRSGGENDSFLECHFCAGIWLSIPHFEKIVESSKTNESDNLLFEKSKVLPQNLSSEAGSPQGHFYKQCPFCKILMLRRNAAMSGVIIDYCKDHGVWFDGNELAELIHWIKQGGLHKWKGNHLLSEKISSPSPVASQASGWVEYNKPKSAVLSALDFIVDLIWR